MGDEAAGIGRNLVGKLQKWVKDGSTTLVAVCTVTEMARDLLDLPIEKICLTPAVAVAKKTATISIRTPTKNIVPSTTVTGNLICIKDYLKSLASLMSVLRDEFVDPTSKLFCPG